ncbi:hypothetical protein M9H77_27356 [Catharanthus roseus]|uniref:Uncharacterized protein n=1 Tax=Catharanthus roseus TaxID=4058 RepID=A0ACC0AF07_CATRO|nr:hypothetical protein M9H77_27356 [Catharanthus roseus]
MVADVDGKKKAKTAENKTILLQGFRLRSKQKVDQKSSRLLHNKQLIIIKIRGTTERHLPPPWTVTVGRTMTNREAEWMSNSDYASSRRLKQGFDIIGKEHVHMELAVNFFMEKQITGLTPLHRGRNMPSIFKMVLSLVNGDNTSLAEGGYASLTIVLEPNNDEKNGRGSSEVVAIAQGRR